MLISRSRAHFKMEYKNMNNFSSNEHRKPLKIHLLKSKSFFKKNYMKLTDDNSIFHKNPSLHVSLPKYHISFSPSSLNFSIFLFNRTLEKKAVISKSSMKIFHHSIYNVLFIGKFTKLLATFRNSKPILAFFEF